MRKAYHEKVKQCRIGIVYAEWNNEITYALRDGAIQTGIDVGIAEENLIAFDVSGAFELPLACKYLIESGKFDGIVAIGCLVKGETPHFHYISEVVSHRLSELGVENNIPIGFGLLTVNEYLQAQERAGGSFGNKGSEAIEAVFNLLSLKFTLG